MCMLEDGIDSSSNTYTQLTYSLIERREKKEVKRMACPGVKQSRFSLSFFNTLVHLDRMKLIFSKTYISENPLHVIQVSFHPVRLSIVL